MKNQTSKEIACFFIVILVLDVVLAAANLATGQRPMLAGICIGLVPLILMSIAAFIFDES